MHCISNFLWKSSFFGLNTISTATRNASEVCTLKFEFVYTFLFAFQVKIHNQKGKLRRLNLTKNDINNMNRSRYYQECPINISEPSYWKAWALAFLEIGNIFLGIYQIYFSICKITIIALKFGFLCRFTISLVFHCL